MLRRLDRCVALPCTTLALACTSAPDARAPATPATAAAAPATMAAARAFCGGADDAMLELAPAFAPTLGLIGAEAIFADFDGDSWPDLLVANGLEITPQPLTLFRHLGRAHGKPLAARPSWYSRVAYARGLAAGDVDRDGDVDAVVAVSMDVSRSTRGGGVFFLENRGGALADPTPIATGFSALDVALGDLDGDGRLDLAVAAYAEGRDGPAPSDPLAPDLVPAPLYVYWNEFAATGQFSPVPWTSATRDFASGLDIADVDGDGDADVIALGRTLAVHHGRDAARGAGPRGLERVPEVLADDYCLGVAVAAVRGGAIAASGWKEVAGASCAYYDAAASRPTLTLYETEREGMSARGQPRARELACDLPAGARPSQVLAAELDGRDGVDLVASYWNGPPCWFFADERGALPARATTHAAALPACGEVRDPELGGGIAAADLRRRADVTTTLALAVGRGPVVELGRDVGAVRAVRLRDGTPLPFAWASGASWLSLGARADARGRELPALAPGTPIDVDAAVAERLDVLVTNGNHHQTHRLFRACPAERRLAAEEK